MVDAKNPIEAACKAHCDYFGGEGWWETGLIADTIPKAMEAMQLAIAAYHAAAPDLAARVIELEAENAELRKQADALAEALERAVGELYAPEPGCSCHISPPCSDCVDYAGIREVNALGHAAYRSIKP